LEVIAWLRTPVGGGVTGQKRVCDLRRSRLHFERLKERDQETAGEKRDQQCDFGWKKTKRRKNEKDEE